MRATLVSSPAKKITTRLGEAANTKQPYFLAEYADHTSTTFVEGGADGWFNDVASVDVIAVPAAATQRVCRSVIVHNADVIPHTVFIEHDNASDKGIICNGTLAAGATLYFRDGLPAVTFAGPGNLEVAGSQRVFQSQAIRVAASFLTITGVAYWIYIGRTLASITPKYVEGYLNVLGATLTLAEAGIFSTPLPPCKAAQTLTKIAAVAVWDSLTVGLGVKRSAVMGTAVPPGTNLWIGAKFAFTTLPSFGGLIYDNLQGGVLITSAAAAFSTAGPWTGALPAAVVAAAATTNCPNLQLTLD